jgi:hypothetical protein
MLDSPKCSLKTPGMVKATSASSLMRDGITLARLEDRAICGMAENE